MNKGEIINLIPGGSGKIDSAVPLDWSIKAREIGVDPSMYVWDYRTNSIHGQPLCLYPFYLESLEKSMESMVEEIIEIKRLNHVDSQGT